MKHHLNTLFVTLDKAYLAKDGAAVTVRHDKQTKLRVPLHNLDGIVAFGWDTGASPALMHACAEADVTLSFCTPHGKFLAAVRGFTSGNILLRREQYRRADDELASAAIARNCIAAKLYNCRTVLQRALRDHGDARSEDQGPDPVPSTPQPTSLARAVDYFQNRIQYLQIAPPEKLSLDSLRGVEGDCAALYFECFNRMITADDPAMRLNGRSRRPPLDPVNALLSFLYAMLSHDLRSACEVVGLDPQCGFLHRDRPGRPSLALDLMEEFRPVFADRLALSLINRRQIGVGDFDKRENGAYRLKEKSRKKVLVAWQERKQTEVTHPFLQEKTTFGLFPHLQARLLARHLRGDIDAYPAFLWK